MNYIELVQTVFTNADDEEADGLIWEGTSFPFGSGDLDMDANDWYLHQLRELHEASGGDVAKAFDIAHARVEKGMEEFRKKYPA